MICRGFLVLTGLLSFIGCYQYYTAYVDQVIEVMEKQGHFAG